MLRRSQLFVPGNDDRKIIKSFKELDCDSIVLDLEDSIPDELKDQARATVRKYLVDQNPSTLESKTRKEVCVRVNPIGSPYFDGDVKALKGIQGLDALMIPKAESSDKLSQVFKETGKNLIVLIETAYGLVHLQEIAGVEGVIALSFGAADFANSVGGDVRRYMSDSYVKTQIAVVAKSFGLDPIDNVFFDLADMDGFEKQARDSRELGYTGKQVIHPAQIAVANEVFSPSKDEIKKAKEIVESYERASSKGLGAIRLDNELVDAVHYRRAKDILEKAGA